jgi:hypothetical protein
MKKIILTIILSLLLATTAMAQLTGEGIHGGGGSGGSMTYPGIGIPYTSDGASWGTSFGVGTMTDGKTCTYATSGNTIACNTTPTTYAPLTSPAFVTDIHASTAGGATLGTALLPFGSIYLGNAATNNIQLTGTAASAKVVTIPGQTGTVTVAPTTTTANQHLSGTATAGLGAWSTSTYADTFAQSSILYAGTANTVTGLAPTVEGTYLRAGASPFVPVWSTLILPNAGTIYKLPVYSAANTITELAAVGATNQMLIGQTGAIPAWSTYTMPTTITTGDVLYGSAPNVVSVHAATNNAILGWNAAGTFDAYTTHQHDDSAAQFSSATASKGTLKVLLSGSTDGKLLTTAFNHTDNKTLNFPDPTTGDSVAYGSAAIRFNTGGTTARIITLPDAAITVARTDAANTFTGVQTMTDPAITVTEIDGSAHVHLTAANMNGIGAKVYNTGQADAAVLLELPAAAAGLSAVFTVGTARAQHWGICGEHATGNKIMLIAAAGTVVEGSADDCVVMMAAQIGQSFAIWSYKTAAGYDWMAKAISIGTSTFEAHAH